MKLSLHALTVAGLLLPAITLPAQTTQHANKAAVSASAYNRNLLRNGNIEAPTQDDKKVPGWVPVDGLSEAKYGSVAGEWDWGLTGCPGCADHYLRLAFEGDVHALSTSETVDVTSAKEKIDAGKATTQLSAWLGGFLNGDTTSTLNASFQDAAGNELGTLSTDPVDMTTLPKPERGSTGLSLCQKSGAVPAGTRKIVVAWIAKATGNSGDYLALGDNFSLVMTSAE